MTATILDAGPLVAYFNRPDQHHDWALEKFQAIQPPLLICEPVWTEAAFLVLNRGGSTDLFWGLVRKGAVRFAFTLNDDFESVAVLMRRYEDVPMSLADACVLRMSELNRESRVLTTDSHFRFYRRFNRQVVPLVAPW